MVTGADPDIEEGGGQTWSWGWCGHAARQRAQLFSAYDAQRSRVHVPPGNFFYHMVVLLRPSETTITTWQLDFNSADSLYGRFPEPLPFGSDSGSSVFIHISVFIRNFRWQNLNYGNGSLVPRPLPDFISQPWRKIRRRPGTITTSRTGNGGLDSYVMWTRFRNDGNVPTQYAASTPSDRTVKFV